MLSNRDFFGQPFGYTTLRKDASKDVQFTGTEEEMYTKFDWSFRANGFFSHLIHSQEKWDEEWLTFTVENDDNTVYQSGSQLSVDTKASIKVSGGRPEQWVTLLVSTEKNLTPLSDTATNASLKNIFLDDLADDLPPSTYPLSWSSPFSSSAMIAGVPPPAWTMLPLGESAKPAQPSVSISIVSCIDCATAVGASHRRSKTPSPDL